MTNTELKLPACCAAIPPEELDTLTGGAPAWMHTAVRKAKDVLRPYKPYIKIGMELAGAFVSIMAQLEIAKDAAKEINAILSTLD